MAVPRRRVSYIIPPSSAPVPRLALPPPGVSRLGRTGPLLIPQDTATVPSQAPAGTQHRLGIAALALDNTTLLEGHDAPEGILYSGGRDGLVVGWDLGVGMRRKQVEEKEAVDEGWGRRNGRSWELMTGWSDDVIDEDDGDDEVRGTSDGDVLGDVTAFGGRRKQSKVHTVPTQWDLDPERPSKDSRFRQSTQLNMDWINDIILCNNNQTVVSASSDGTVKAWNPHSSNTQPSQIGSHTDFVRCLAHCSTQNWVASGSFDRTIKLWDIGQTSADPIITLNPIDANAPKSSVYAIAADPYGKTIASGSPERVVRMWDPRSGKRISKLVGHTDNIRAILLSDDARYLLTGSADASIKLWSLASQRCLHTFTHHAESVWSLFSSSPSLESFYSGDRAGWVCRVDVEGCSDVAEGECVVLCRDGVEGSPGINGGVNAMVALDDQLVWTASGNNSSIRRWNVPPRRSARASAIQKEFSFIDLETQTPFEQQHRLPPSKKRRSVDSASMKAPSMIRGLDDDEDGTLYDIPYESLVKLVSPFPYTSGGRDPDVATLYSAASVMSFRPMTSSAVRSLFSPQVSAEAAYHWRELASEAKPLVKTPSAVLPGSSGIVRALILNDRIHALTVDTRGEVAVWDLVRGACKGVFCRASMDGLADPAGNGDVDYREQVYAHPQSAREALALVRERVEGEGVTASWSSVDTKAGVLSVHISDRCFEAEVYADEVGFRGRGYTDDSKLNIGKWVLRNLFLGYLKEETRIRKRPGPYRSSFSIQHAEPCSSPGYTVVYAPHMVPAIPGTPSPSIPHAPLRTPLIPIRTSPPLIETSASLPIASPGVDATPMQTQRRLRSSTIDSAKGDDYFSVKRQNSLSAGANNSSDDARSDPTTPGGGFIGRLKNFGKSKATAARPLSEILPTLSGIVGEPEEINTAMPLKDEKVEEEEEKAKDKDIDIDNVKETEKKDERPKTALEDLLSQPFNPPSSTDAPAHAFPHGITVLISDEDGFGGWTVKYHGWPHLSFSHFGGELEARRRVAELEQTLPLWVLEFLHQAKIPPAPAAVKLSFVLLPWRDDLPELINTQQSKLTANRFLRVRKLVLHVQEKLDKLTHSPSSPPRASSRTGSTRSSLEDPHLQRLYHHHTALSAEQQYEILCNDVVLPLDMSLAAVRQYVWRQSAELVMHYRKKTYNGT